MKYEIEVLLASLVRNAFGVDIVVELTRPEAQFGDYSTNVALQLSKQLGKNPREIAENLAEHVKGQSSHITAVEVAGPGFLNIWLSDEALLEAVKTDRSKSCLVNRLSPNIPTLIRSRYCMLVICTPALWAMRSQIFLRTRALQCTG
ncbi:hypothetical protein IPL68_03105 [Candidatus Saccharibacteria bacterium]|nr:MAG: hypothetical protein IPL68_03105 [Candidatus Saccharibacteria bacterium]